MTLLAGTAIALMHTWLTQADAAESAGVRITFILGLYAC